MIKFYGDEDIVIKRLLLVSAVIFVLLYVILLKFDPPTDDVLVFYDYSQMFKDGTLFDDGAFAEYPPLAWIFILLPGMFSDSLDVYNAIYSGLDILCMFLLGMVLMRICKGRVSNLSLIMVVYLVITLIYADQAVKKFDIVPVLMMTASLMYFLERKDTLAVIFAIIGAMMKVFPILLILVFFIILIKDRGRLIGLFKCLVICCLVCLAIVMLLFLTGIEMDVLFGFISFQSDRGFHIESTVGSLSVVICSIMGLETSYIGHYHTYDVDNVICGALIDNWSFVMVAVMLVVLFAVLILSRKMDYDDEAGRFKYLTAASLALLLSLILVNKVFSTQFVQWFYPLVVMYLCYRDRKEFAVLTSVYVVIMVLSRTFTIIESQELLVVRDVLMLILIISAILNMAGSGWGNPIRNRLSKSQA